MFVNCFAHSLNKTDLSKLEKQKIKKIFNKGEIIYTENKSADNIFTLIEGIVNWLMWMICVPLLFCE